MAASLLTLFPWFLCAALACVLVFLLGRQRRLDAERQRSVDRVRRQEQIVAQQSLTLARMRQAIESASDAIGIGDMEGTSLYHNRAHLALFGYTVEALNATPGSGVLFADPVVAGDIHRSIRAGRSWSGETEVRTADGRLVPVFVRADIILDENRQPVGIFGVFTDITARREAQRELQRQQRKLEVTLRGISDAVITIDERGCIVLMNPAAERLAGTTAAEAVGRELEQVISLLDELTAAPRSSAALQLIAAGSAATSSATVYKLKDPSGPAHRLVAENAAILQTDDGAIRGAVLALRDITRERQQAEEAARAGKLESLGLLAGGIAHDFGNLLAAMLGHISLAKLDRTAPPAVHARLDQLEQVVWRARDVTQQLVTFARGGSLQKRRVALGPILRESVQMAVASHPVQDLVDVSTDLWEVEADEGQLVQVFNNLAVNAVQAMPAGGSLTVSARNRSGGGATGGQSFLEISFSDTGTGIPPENLSRIFDPFFTTKRTGSGLGLATCHSIVSQHGGRMQVESALGRGTTFQVILPAAAEPAAATGSEPPVPGRAIAARAPARPEPKGRSGRVLVVESDRAARETLGLALGLLDCEVTEARDAFHAVEVFVQAQGTPRAFRAVLADLDRPQGLDAWELHRCLRRVQPTVRLVGLHQADPPALPPGADPSVFAALLHKPVSTVQLKAALAL